MGMPSAQVQSGTQPQGKGSPFNRMGGPSPSIGSMPSTPPPPSIGAMPPEDVMASIGATPPNDNNFKQGSFRPELVNMRPGPQVLGGENTGMTGRPQSTFRPELVNIRPDAGGFAVQAPRNPFLQMSGGKGGSTTNAATSGQPTFGQPNRYPNTVGQWDNASIQRTNQQPMGGGKGKG